MEPTFEYCALRYLLQWERKERKLHKQFKKRATRDELRKALRFFQVARNFKDLKKDKSADFILAVLSKVRKNTKMSPEEKVESLASKLKSKFGQRNLSAASKMLWLSQRSQIILYDARAVRTLKGMCESRSDFNPKRYESYCTEWRKQYKARAPQILQAVKRLRHVRPFLMAWHASDKELVRLVTKPWFKERVFDMYLWESAD